LRAIYEVDPDLPKVIAAWLMLSAKTSTLNNEMPKNGRHQTDDTDSLCPPNREIQIGRSQ